MLIPSRNTNPNGPGKKGVIPVFVSFLWFVFALALSIQLAYSQIGGNEAAHNLALGFLVRSTQ